nr:5-hydroxytryptamine receptor 1D-like [Lytechinus pictus]
MASDGMIGEPTSAVVTPLYGSGTYQPNTETLSWEYWTNSSGNETESNGVHIIFGPLAAVGIITIYSIIIIGTILGNLLVLTSVCLEKKLRSPPNILIINLAVADILVAVLVMPLAASYDLSGQWIFSQALCDMFICFDVTCCTASIVDLCVISVDRYLAISRPFRYARHRTTRLMLGLVAGVWTISAFISFSPLLIFQNEHTAKHCLLSQDPIYTIYSTLTAFYVPLLIMVVVYYKIYRAAGEIERRELQRRPSTPALLPRGSVRSGSISSEGDSSSNPSKELRRKSSIVRFTEYIRSASRNSLASVQGGKNKISVKLERKASKTLGIIMGAFVICWLPFFILAIARVFCNCVIPQALHGTLVWLGYVNCMLNPIIYPFFNKDFGPAYRKMLSYCCCRLCPGRRNYTPNNRRFTPVRRQSFVTHPVIPPELHVIAEDSHDEEPQENGNKSQMNCRKDMDGIKYNSVHLDKLNGNSKDKDNLNEITATHV